MKLTLEEKIIINSYFEKKVFTCRDMKEDTFKRKIYDNINLSEFYVIPNYTRFGTMIVENFAKAFISKYTYIEHCSPFSDSFYLTHNGRYGVCFDDYLGYPVTVFESDDFVESVEIKDYLNSNIRIKYFKNS